MSSSNGACKIIAPRRRPKQPMNNHMLMWLLKNRKRDYCHNSQKLQKYNVFMHAYNIRQKADPDHVWRSSRQIFLPALPHTAHVSLTHCHPPYILDEIPSAVVLAETRYYLSYFYFFLFLFSFFCFCMRKLQKLLNVKNVCDKRFSIFARSFTTLIVQFQIL